MGFYHEGKGQLLEGFEPEGHDLFIFLKTHSSCQVEDRLKGARVLARDSGGAAEPLQGRTDDVLHRVGGWGEEGSS